MATDGAGKIVLAPVVYTVPVVSVLAWSCPDLLVRSELDQTNGASVVIWVRSGLFFDCSQYL